jgi:hypothetical protein
MEVYMNLREFKSEFEYELENGLDHAEWYEKEIKWLIHRIERLEKVQKVTDNSYRELLKERNIYKTIAESGECCEVKYNEYLEVKRSVIEEDATVNYVKERLGVSILIARCLVKDWHEQNEGSCVE